MLKPVQNTRESSGQAARRREAGSRLLPTLGRGLNEAATVRRVAEVILEAADALLGWDAASLDLYSPELDTTDCILAMDLVEGRRAEVTPVRPGAAPSPRMRQVIGEGAQLILREGTPQFAPDSTPFGDTSRPSASLLFVPVMGRNRVLGVLTIQSYIPQAYTRQDLDVLLGLADHCAGAVGRIRTQDALRQEQTLMFALMENLPARVYFKDAASRFLRVSPALAKLFGFSDPAQLVGKSDADFFSAEHARQALADEQDIIRTGQPLLGIEEKETWPDGAESWVLTSKSPLRDGAGRIIGTCGISSDITERKRAELSALAMSKLGQSLILATTQNEAARLLLQVADELFGWDACAFYLYSPETDLAQPVLYMDIIDGRRVEVPPPTLPGKPSPVDCRVIEKGAELILKEASSPAMDPMGTSFGDTSRPSAAIMRVPLRLRTEKVTGIVAIHSYTPQAYTQKDLKTLQTLADCCGMALERIWADEALRDSEQRFRDLFEGSPDAVFVEDLNGTVLDINPAAGRLHGATRNDLIGKHVLDLIPPERREEAAGDFRALVEGRLAQIEGASYTQDGRMVPVEVRASRVNYAGQSAVLLHVRDITSRKQTEAELARMHQQLLEVSRQAGMAEVATNVLHNVGNVLNSVNVSSSLISDKVRASKAGNLAKAVALLQAHENDLAAFLADDPKGRQLPGYLRSLADHLDAEQHETLKELKSLAANIDHIKEIITMQQSYARVVGVVESLPVVDLVEDALRLNAGAMERHQVKIVREYFKVPPILVDKHKVLQILVNLIRNAKYALDDRGHTDKRLVLQVGLNGNDLVKISVIDNGIGIPPENLTRIFEHGFTTRREGHGFGLHNGALAAKELGGKLTAHSDGPGKGATFTLELPPRPREKGHSTELRSKRG
ncbi:MAG: PAS domain S-box protein [Verrucomicrobiota bacterium]|jgi:PAS domain S-box-containing protein